MNFVFQAIKMTFIYLVQTSDCFFDLHNNIALSYSPFLKEKYLITIPKYVNSSITRIF